MVLVVKPRMPTKLHNPVSNRYHPRMLCPLPNASPQVQLRVGINNAMAFVRPAFIQLLINVTILVHTRT